MSVTDKQVAALYVAVFNRAPDQAGLNYWVDTDNFETIANGFVGHPVFEEKYGEMNSEEFITAIYQNILGGEGDVEGIEHWVGRLENDGWTRAEVLAQFINETFNYEGDDAEALVRKQFLENKVDVALYYTETLGEASNLSPDTDFDSVDVVNDPVYQQSQEILAGVDATEASVEAAKAAVDAIATGDDNSLLVEALEVYQDAQAAEAEFLEELASNKTFLNAFDADDPADAAILSALEDRPATDTDIDAAVENVTDSLDKALDKVINGTEVGGIIVDGGNLVGENTLAGIIADTKIAAAKQVADEKKDLADAESDLTSAQLRNLNNLENRLNSAVAAEENVTAAVTEVTRQAEIAQANFKAAGVTTPVNLDDDTASDPLLEKNDNGVWVLAEAGKELPAAQQAFLKPYVAALNAQVKAEATATAAYEVLNEAFEALDATGAPVIDPTDLAAFKTAGLLDGDPTATPPVPYSIDATAFGADVEKVVIAREDLATAELNQAELLKAVSAFDAIREISDHYDELVDAVTAAEKAITDSEEDGGLGILLTEIENTVTANTGEVDLFVYTGKEGAVSLLEADDMIFFGTEYTFVELAANVDISQERLGDAEVLEIFYQAQGDNFVFYVEKDAEAGRELSADNLVEVELVGVSEFGLNGGFVTIE